MMTKLEYDRIETRVLVRILLLSEDRKQALLLRRHQDEGFAAGDWELPQGGRERGESAEAAIMREVEEELGQAFLAHMSPLRFSHTSVFEIVHDNGRERVLEDWVNINYVSTVGDAESAPVTLCSDHEDYCWLGIDKAIEVLGQAEHAAAAIELLKRNR